MQARRRCSRGSSREVTDDLLRTNTKIPLGKPYAGVTFYIVDDTDQVVTGAWEAGELCIGGVQVMEGYLGDPETNARVIRTDLIAGDRVYRTGDLVQRNAEDEYVYLDRLDQVIKRAGTRIALAEIVAALREIPHVHDAVCITEQVGSRLMIIAYVASQHSLSAQAVRSDLAKAIPATMMPDQMHVVANLPRKATGKLSRDELKAELSQPARPPTSKVTELDAG